MKLVFSNETDFVFDSEMMDMFNEAIKTALEFEGFSQNWEVGLTIVDGENIRQLNGKFRGIDRATDVLSFPLYDNWDKFPKEEGGAILGDIVINIEKAVEQSREYGHSLKRELGFLTVHSMLHLMGYDHMTEDEEKEMFDRQRKILDKMGLKR